MRVGPEKLWWCTIVTVDGLVIEPANWISYIDPWIYGFTSGPVSRREVNTCAGFLFVEMNARRNAVKDPGVCTTHLTVLTKDSLTFHLSIMNASLFELLDVHCLTVYCGMINCFICGDAKI